MYLHFHKWLLLCLLTIIMFFFSVSPSPAQEYWKNKYLRFSATAGETLAAGDIVCIKGSDGKAYKADANDSSLRPAVGVIGIGGTSGETVEIVTIGVLEGQTSASPGARLFLSETAGVFTTTAPTNEQPVGWVLPGTTAATSTKYYIMTNMPVTDGAGY